MWSEVDDSPNFDNRFDSVCDLTVRADGILFLSCYDFSNLEKVYIDATHGADVRLINNAGLPP
jgi:hypothetical protein